MIDDINSLRKYIILNEASKQFVEKNFNDVNDPEKIKFNRKLFASIKNLLVEPLATYTYNVLKNNLTDKDIGYSYTMMRMGDDAEKTKIITLYYHVYNEYFIDYLNATYKKNDGISGIKTIDIRVINNIKTIVNSKEFLTDFIKMFASNNLISSFSENLFDKSNPYINENDTATYEKIVKALPPLKPSILNDIKNDLKRNMGNVSAIYNNLQQNRDETLAELSVKHIINYFGRYVFKSVIKTLGQDYIKLVNKHLKNKANQSKLSLQISKLYKNIEPAPDVTEPEQDEPDDKQADVDMDSLKPLVIIDPPNDPRKNILNWFKINPKFTDSVLNSKGNKVLKPYRELYKFLKQNKS